MGSVVLVREKEMQKTTASGIVIPDTVDAKKVKLAEVLAIGTKIELPIAPDDLVLIPFDANGIPVESGDGETYKLIAESNILAKLT
jgi:co-chaperonin GroES (HSP10)